MIEVDIDEKKKGISQWCHRCCRLLHSASCCCSWGNWCCCSGLTSCCCGCASVKYGKAGVSEMVGSTVDMMKIASERYETSARHELERRATGAWT